jgi:hypothetical protein
MLGDNGREMPFQYIYTIVKRKEGKKEGEKIKREINSQNNSP